MRRKGVVFSKMFVFRSMGNKLVPLPQQAQMLRLKTVHVPIVLYIMALKKWSDRHNFASFKITMYAYKADTSNKTNK